MHVEGQRAVRTQGGDDGRAEADIGHEMAVHDVELDHLDAGGLHLGHFRSQAAEIGRQDRGNDLNCACSLVVAFWLERLPLPDGLSCSSRQAANGQLASFMKLSTQLARLFWYWR